jgi:hypothetical protein
MEHKETLRHVDMLDMETWSKELGAGTSVSVAKTSKGQTDGLPLDDPPLDAPPPPIGCEHMAWDCRISRSGAHSTSSSTMPSSTCERVRQEREQAMAPRHACASGHAATYDRRRTRGRPCNIR